MAIDVTTSVERGVDETPISPLERRNSLEKHLQHRPDAQDLKNRHILLDTTAAPFVARFLFGLLLAPFMHGCADPLLLLVPKEAYKPPSKN
jgi:hypothetical protein